MTARDIVRDADILSGRWHFEGTTIPIAAIISDHDYGHDELKDQYRFMNLSDEEIKAAMAFEFPEVRDPVAYLEYASVTMECVCGEETRKAATSPEVETVECPCRRTWHLVITPELRSYHPRGRADRGAT